MAGIEGHYVELLMALDRAGITTPMGKWAALPGTNLVGLGDYIGAGPDNLLTFDLLWELRAEARRAGSRVTLYRGPHERELLAALGGDEAYRGWLKRWGLPFLVSVGVDRKLAQRGSAAWLRQVLDVVMPAMPRAIRAMTDSIVSIP